LDSSSCRAKSGLGQCLQRDLDRGEAESIALALELGANLLLVDERDARHIAQRLALPTIGVIGILFEAKSKGLIKPIRPHLDALRQVTGFYLKESLYQTILQQAGEGD
jgi:predicted nucleic acid-binding protein